MLGLAHSRVWRIWGMHFLWRKQNNDQTIQVTGSRRSSLGQQVWGLFRTQLASLREFLTPYGYFTGPVLQTLPAWNYLPCQIELEMPPNIFQGEDSWLLLSIGFTIPQQMWNISLFQWFKLFSLLMPENWDNVGWWWNWLLLMYFWHWNGWQSVRSSGVAFSTMAPDLQPFF